MCVYTHERPKSQNAQCAIGLISICQSKPKKRPGLCTDCFQTCRLADRLCNSILCGFLCQKLHHFFTSHLRCGSVAVNIFCCDPQDLRFVPGVLDTLDDDCARCAMAWAMLKLVADRSICRGWCTCARSSCRGWCTRARSSRSSCNSLRPLGSSSSRPLGRNSPPLRWCRSKTKPSTLRIGCLGCESKRKNTTTTTTTNSQQQPTSQPTNKSTMTQTTGFGSSSALAQDECVKSRVRI